MTDALDFSGKLIVITGVGRAGQVGEAVALAFAQRRAQVAMVIALGLTFDVDTVIIPCHVSTVNIDSSGCNTPKRRA